MKLNLLILGETFGHNIKGSGGMYGFNEVTEIGAVIEAAAKDEDMALIKSNLNDLDLFPNLSYKFLIISLTLTNIKTKKFTLHSSS